MIEVEQMFKMRKVNAEKLLSFGFMVEGEIYTYRKLLTKSNLLLCVELDREGSVKAEVIDPAFQEPYTLHLMKGAVGEFVASVREEYEEALFEIAKNCFEETYIKTSQASEVITYIRDTYGDELEYLWKNSKNAIWRRNDSKKWYAAFLTLAARKLGFDSDKDVEVINLRIRKEDIQALIDYECFFPAFHMNKKSWYSLILDGRVSLEEVCNRIDVSYELAKK